MRLQFLCLGILIVLSPSLNAASLRLETNWEYEVYIAEGQAVVSNPNLKASREKAMQDAKASAADRMMSLILKTEIQGIDPAQVLGKNPVAKRKVLNIANSGTIVASKYITEQNKTVAIATMKIPVFGQNFPGSVIISAAQENQALPKVYATELDDNFSSVIQPIYYASHTVKDSNTTGYSSLVLDATGLALNKSKCPKILRPDNSAAWMGLNIPVDQVEEFGIAAYSTNLNSAYKNPRCGLRPLIVRAKSVAGKSHFDVVVSDEDADLILYENQKSGFLEKMNVIIVASH